MDFKSIDSVGLLLVIEVTGFYLQMGNSECSILQGWHLYFDQSVMVVQRRTQSAGLSECHYTVLG